MGTSLEAILQGTPFLFDPVHGSKLLEAALGLSQQVELLRSNGQLREDTLAMLRNEWGFVQVHESAGIEGNALTLNETQMAILQGITVSGKPPKHSAEVKNLHQAIEFLENLVRNHNCVTEQEIRQVHAFVLGEGDPNAGSYRSIEVTISGAEHKPPLAIAVPGEMQKLCNWLQHAQQIEIPTPLVSAVFHAWLVHIHPFADGNGRTARALTNLILMRAGFPVVVVRRRDRQRYYDGLRSADDGDIGPVLELLVQRSGDSLRQIDRIRLATEGVNNAILQVQAVEKQRFQIWLDSIGLCLSTIHQALQNVANTPGFTVEFRRYDLPDEDAFLALQRREVQSNSWLTRITISRSNVSQSLLLWMGLSSYELEKVAGTDSPIPAIQLSMRNPDGYPQWVRPDETFPTRIREIAYHQGSYFCLRSKNPPRVSKEESVLLLANKFAEELILGWFAK